MQKKILVTGASGKLGNVVSPYLYEKGFRVTNFDKTPQDRDSANAKANIPYVQGDLLSLGDCMRAIAHAQPDVIVHLGAITYNPELQPAYDHEYTFASDGSRFTQRMDEDEAMKVNVMGTYYVLDAARRLGVKDIVAASSYFASGIGFRISGTSYMPEYLPIDEKHPCTPEDTYSLSKLLNEETMKAYCRAYGMNCIAMRLMGVYYDYLEFSRNIYKFNITVPEPAPGQENFMISNTWQYVDARDIALFVEKAVDAKGLNPFEAFYVVTDTTYNEDTVDVIKKRWPAFAAKGMGAGIKGTDGIFTYEKARKLIGYEPKHSWRNKK